MAVSLMPGDPALALPTGARLLHVGLPKTGTTALQRTAAQQRPELLRQGVLYPGKRFNHRKAGYAFEGRAMAWGATPPSRGAWTRVLAEIRADRTSRVWLDNESWYDLPADRAAQLLDELGGEVHAVLTLRSISAQLSSSWSEYLKTGLKVGFERWAEGVLADPPKAGLTPSFPRRNDLRRLVAQWVDVVGADSFTVVVLDPADRDLVPRTFETLLGLESGTLTGVQLEGGDANRSFTLAEAELVRSLNVSLRARSELTFAEFDRFVRASAMVGMLQRTPAPDEPRIVPPRWAVERTVEMAEGHRRAIEAMDVRVVGDLAELARPVASAEEPPQIPGLPLEAAHAAVQACVEAGVEADREARAARSARAVPPLPHPQEATGPVAVLAKVLGDRARRAVRARRG